MAVRKLEPIENKAEISTEADIKSLLKKYFGFSDFKPGQAEIINSILQGHDTLGIMPTGGGKSVCYQLPALILPGMSLVISPLIALMKDQVDALNNLGIAASFISSALTYNEIQARLLKASQGRYKILYVAPERLAAESSQQMLSNLPLSLITIDEAHCLSQWGHDFRPHYLDIAPWIAQLPQRPVLAAFTATATERVQEDIVKLLNLDAPNLFITGFDRENLFYSVVKGADRSKFIKQYIKGHREQAGIIYAATRKEVDTIFNSLQSLDYRVGRYHAGLSAEERNDSQEAFIYDNIQVMVATNAFGLGIDKSNIRYVIHYNMPRSLEAYYQEAGRAGRDGQPGDCILLYHPADIPIQKFLIEQTVLSPERKHNEYIKLQEMIDYCHTTRCLREYILKYFGEQNVDECCNNCNNCVDFDTRDITIEGQKIFSCIVRTRQQYGATLIASVLKGSHNKRIQQLGFNHLSTYGIMDELSIAEIVDLINLLAAEDYLHITAGQYPLVVLTQKALPVLKGRERIIVRIPRPREAAVEDNSLFQALRSLRQEIALKENVPPYVIFHDSTLRQMAAIAPTDSAAMLTVSGVGEVKLERYGAAFLKIIRDYVDRSGLQPVPAVQLKKKVSAAEPSLKPTGAEKKKDKVPSHILTWNLYNEGKSLDEIARQRGLKLRTVQDQLLRSAAEGQPLKWSDFFNAHEEEQVLTVVKQVGHERLKPIKEVLPDIAYFTIQAVLCKNQLD